MNSRPRLPVSGGRAAINMLGAVTDTGEHFVALTPDSFTATVSKYFLRALRDRFGKKLVIVLDNAPYFIAKDLKKQAAGDGLLLEYLPPYAPELNPLENCWLQLKAARKNRLFETIDDVKRFLTATIPRLTAPKVYHYLC
ncbi:IS630 family transposase [Halobellus inordinatus]|uniref:IS630 family transposase n=1 Tax=Halobellus inordinatus TaxID=1126236 RepID=UPI00211400ED|nr:IS630 family transposase [Halobellus ramosii]